MSLSALLACAGCTAADEPTDRPAAAVEVASEKPQYTPKLLWRSDFDNLAETGTFWGVQNRWGEGDGEKQYYTDGTANMTVNDTGALVIETRREPPPDNRGAPYDYTSARVVTRDKQSVRPPVRVVGRMQLPYTKGILPAFWLRGLEPGHEYDWPRAGEIDIVELPGMGPASGSGHWTGNIHGPSASDNTQDVKLDSVGADLGVDLSAGFHDYGIDWTPDAITWTVDGREMATVTRSEYEARGGDWTPFSGAWPYYLVLDTAVGNAWTGDPDRTSVFPQRLVVDWIKVYSLV
ncbi:glycoside hydrolase family 16 protein [Mycobacterium sp. C31M]